MKWTGLSLVVIVCVAAHAQGNTSPAPAADPQLHADVLTLVELEGSKQRAQASLQNLLDLAKTQMLKAAPSCVPAFADEWVKRMRARINADDFVNVEIAAYERNLNDADVRELIALVKKQKASPGSAVASPELQQKLEKVMPSLQSEIMGGTTQIGAKLGAEIGQEISKEHPEYCRQGTDPKK